MKTLLKLSCLTFLLLSLSCSKNDNDPPAPIEEAIEADAEDDMEVAEEENSAPSEFELVVLPDAAVEVDVLPIFSWNASTDPDGDTVVYDLYLDEGDAADKVFAEDIEVNSYEVKDRLELTKEYAWKVVARDSEGASVTSDTRTFSTRPLRFNDVPETANAAFSARQLHSSIVYEDRIWVIGGSIIGAGTVPFKDVWFTEDGINWDLATESADYGARAAHSSVVFDGKMWVIGGFDDTGKIKNDVWASKDGETWNVVVKDAPFNGRAGHTSVVYDNKIWLIGGVDTDNNLQNDVWVSQDGFTWKEVSGDAGFEARNLHSTVAFEDGIYVIGGRNKLDERLGDVWFSKDGINWDVLSKDADFTGRFSHTSIVFDNKMWVIGGLDEEFNWKNDAWFSKDGKIWTEAINAAPFSRRFRHSSVVFKNKAWVIAGTGEANNVQNDVWTFE